MSKVTFNSRQLVASFTSTLGVGSSWVSSPVDMSQYNTVVGISWVGSSNVVVEYEQGGINGSWDVSSTIASPAGTTVLDWTNYGQFGQFSISTVNSTQGELMRFHVYGVI